MYVYFLQSQRAICKRACATIGTRACTVQLRLTRRSGEIGSSRARRKATIVGPSHRC